MTRIRIAAHQQQIGFYTTWDEYAHAQEARVLAAVQEGATLLVFPEYGAMELASLFGPEVYGSLDTQLAALQEVHESFLALHRGLAERYHATILAPSLPVRINTSAGSEYRNRAYLVQPDRVDFQEKLMMTRFERESWGISPGQALPVIAMGDVKVGITICYDIEFPLLARALAEAGADILLAPSCTDTVAGYHRVRVGAMARALENQCYVIHAATVGQALWSPAVDVNIGAAAVYTPPDRGMPDDGVLAMGPREREEHWVIAELDLAAMRAVRQDGQVLNYQHWPEQARTLG